MSISDRDDTEDMEVSSEVLLLHTPSSFGSLLSNRSEEGVVLLELVSDHGSSSAPSL